MRTKSLLVAVLMLATASAFGQRHKLGEINTEKPEGQLLQKIGQESDDTKKLQLLEQFVNQYPKDEALAWVYEQMGAVYVKANQPDKALEAGDKLLALDPSDMESAHANLKLAEAKKDPALVRKWAALTGTAAQKTAASPKPKEEDEVEGWKQRVEYAKQVGTYAQYSLYATALQQTELARKVELLEELQRLDPGGEYFKKGAPQLFLAYRQANQNDKAVALAEKVVATDQSDPDMLLVVANDYLQKKRDPDKVLAYSAKVVELMNAQAKPEGVSDADWTNRKNTVIGVAHYLGGYTYFNQNKFGPADKELSAALPLVASNANLKPEVLFLLGVANYKMKEPQKALNYFRECAGMKSRFQGEAGKNVTRIKSEYSGLK